MRAQGWESGNPHRRRDWAAAGAWSRAAHRMELELPAAGPAPGPPPSFVLPSPPGGRPLTVGEPPPALHQPPLGPGCVESPWDTWFLQTDRPTTGPPVPGRPRIHAEELMELGLQLPSPAECRLPGCWSFHKGPGATRAPSDTRLGQTERGALWGEEITLSIHKQTKQTHRTSPALSRQKTQYNATKKPHVTPHRENNLIFTVIFQALSVPTIMSTYFQWITSCITLFRMLLFQISHHYLPTLL